MFLKFSLWSVEDDDEGTIAWAGGAASFSEGPFTMHIKNLKVQDYSKALTYSYGNLRDGNWLDLRADGGYLYEGHKYCLPPKMLDKLKPTPKQETDDDQVFTSSKLQGVATTIGEDKNTVSYYPPLLPIHIQHGINYWNGKLNRIKQELMIRKTPTTKKKKSQQQLHLFQN